MIRVTTELERLQPSAEDPPGLFADWFDPIETGLRERVRGLIEEMIRGELDAVLSRPRYGRRAKVIGVRGDACVAIEGGLAAPDTRSARRRI